MIDKINAMRKNYIIDRNTNLNINELQKKTRGEYFFGFSIPEIAEIIERIPATQFCKLYTPKFSLTIRIPKKLYLLVAGMLNS